MRETLKIWSGLGMRLAQVYMAATSTPLIALSVVIANPFLWLISSTYCVLSHQ